MHDISRRSFIQGSILASATSMVAANAQAGTPDSKNTATAITVKETLPKGKIGNLELSRLMIGGNLITNFMHSRDLKYVDNLSSHYNTDDKILETFRISEEYGIDTIITHADPRIMSLLKKHRYERGGKMKWIINVMGALDNELKIFSEKAKQVVDEGADGLYLFGANADTLALHGKVEMIARTVAIMKEQKVPAGVGAHDLNVIKVCEQNKIPAEFYVKTFHHLKYPTAPKPEQIRGSNMEIPGYWCSQPEETIEVFKKVEKPWIAFKVMAAGAIPPQDAFKYAFGNGADFILAGILDFQIAEDVRITKNVLSGIKRERPWRS
ncbi:MAG: hypothetical protein PHR77_13360 [Kiritimatiellae bacterium]|nr:hypothetical protein [Kiritimatiellia bacterium]MDD5523023.1 hypothetical protein [Kiritimatiellia bacterium]